MYIHTYQIESMQKNLKLWEETGDESRPLWSFQCFLFGSTFPNWCTICGPCLVVKILHSARFQGRAHKLPGRNWCIHEWVEWVGECFCTSSILFMQIVILTDSDSHVTSRRLVYLRIWSTHYTLPMTNPWITDVQNQWASVCTIVYTYTTLRIPIPYHPMLQHSRLSFSMIYYVVPKIKKSTPQPKYEFNYTREYTPTRIEFT